MKKRIFLDYAGGTPLDKRVFRAMRPFLSTHFASPSALYEEGNFLKKTLESSRTRIAGLLRCRKEEIIFTSGGTESNNLAILGVFEAALSRGVKKPHIVTSQIEHPSTLEVCREAARRGGAVTYLRLDSKGQISLRDLEKSLQRETVIVSLSYANSEIGSIIPVRKISAILRNGRKKFPKATIYFHIDASQAAGYMPIGPNELGVDLMTVDASKIYGPRGAGLLFVQRKTLISPIIYGGKQERGLRAGTENLPAIVGLREALAIACNRSKKESARLLPLRNYFINQVLEKIPGAELNGDIENRLPNNVNICFPKSDAEFLVIILDAKGIACASASSCRTLSDETYSYVVEALGKKNCAESSLRFTLGRGTTKKDLDYLLNALQMILS